MCLIRYAGDRGGIERLNDVRFMRCTEKQHTEERNDKRREAGEELEEYNVERN